MGIRRAAQRRQSQYIREHYRTSKNGKVYKVRGHLRNEYSDPLGCLFVLSSLWILFGWLPAAAISGWNPIGFWLIYTAPLWLSWLARWIKNSHAQMTLSLDYNQPRRSELPLKAWQVMVWGSPVAAGDWLNHFGDETCLCADGTVDDAFRYLFTTRRAAEECAAEKVAEGWDETKIEVVEVSTPMVSSVSQPILKIHAGPKGGVFTMDVTKDGRPYRRYF